MKQIVYLCAVFTIFFSCKDDPKVLGNSDFGIKCLVETNARDHGFNCLDNETNDTSIIELIPDAIIGDEFKRFLPYYCLGDRVISYSNIEGTQLNLTLNNDVRYYIGTGWRWNIRDNNDGTSTAFCARGESISFSMNLETYNHPIYFSVVARNRLDYPEGRTDFDISSNSISSFKLSSIDGNINFNEFYGLNLRYTETLELRGKSFNDVYEYINNTSSNHLKFLYNKKYGIIRITDLDGVEWVLDE